jgi:hypothetical protein
MRKYIFLVEVETIIYLFIFVLFLFQISPPHDSPCPNSCTGCLGHGKHFGCGRTTVHMLHSPQSASYSISASSSWGLGLFPNILCAEIFPTTVRGICIAIYAVFCIMALVFFSLAPTLMSHEIQIVPYLGISWKYFPCISRLSQYLLSQIIYNNITGNCHPSLVSLPSDV